MAVEDKYVDSNLVAGKSTNAAFTKGAELVVARAVASIAAADDNGSVYRLFADVPGDYIPIRLDVNNDAITGGTDFDIGLYRTGVGGAVVDKDVFADGLDLSTAHADVSNPVDGLGAPDIAVLQRKIYEHAGHTLKTRRPAYDIALTGNTVGTAAGDVVVTGYFAQG